MSRNIATRSGLRKCQVCSMFISKDAEGVYRTAKLGAMCALTIDGEHKPRRL